MTEHITRTVCCWHVLVDHPHNDREVVVIGLGRIGFATIGCRQRNLNPKQCDMDMRSRSLRYVAVMRRMVVGVRVHVMPM